MKTKNEIALTEEEMVNYLVGEKYITDAVLYTNPHRIKFEEASRYEEALDEINVMLFLWVEILIKMIQLPVLIDDYHDNTETVNGKIAVNKEKRKQIRYALQIHDVDCKTQIYPFYESNKLQGSNLHLTLQALDGIRNCFPLEGTLATKIEELVRALCSVPNSYIVDKYILELNNSEKYDAVNTTTILSEEALMEVFEKVKPTKD